MLFIGIFRPFRKVGNICEIGCDQKEGSMCYRQTPKCRDAKRMAPNAASSFHTTNCNLCIEQDENPGKLNVDHVWKQQENINSSNITLHLHGDFQNTWENI